MRTLSCLLQHYRIGGGLGDQFFLCLLQGSLLICCRDIRRILIHDKGIGGEGGFIDLIAHDLCRGQLYGDPGAVYGDLHFVHIDPDLDDAAVFDPEAFILVRKEEDSLFRIFLEEFGHIVVVAIIHGQIADGAHLPLFQ